MNTKFITKSLLLTTALAIMLLLSMPSRAGLEEANSAYNNKDYKTALREYLPLAKKGNDYAQFKVGELYFEGKGVLQDYEEGYKWLTKSAEQENPLALAMLAVKFADGKGVKRILVFAHAYINLAEANRFKYPELNEKIDVFTKLRDSLEQEMTPSEVEAAQVFAKAQQKYAMANKNGLHLPKYDDVK
ncbi:MAG TPA: tetratricopeptide repeat protein [Methylotenera sp.]|nr:tetratricopeptide repeat protein [Methylotenera sp.]HPH06451.1 tetratricopeptide repeat protein [Methylotenera sp.]HPN00402.1 tetratricopeptide repeat protein [Methylotenera sp.]